jgi:hypothetical protein
MSCLKTILLICCFVPQSLVLYTHTERERERERERQKERERDISLRNIPLNLVIFFSEGFVRSYMLINSCTCIARLLHSFYLTMSS